MLYILVFDLCCMLFLFVLFLCKDICSFVNKCRLKFSPKFKFIYLVDIGYFFAIVGFLLKSFKSYDISILNELYNRILFLSYPVIGYIFLRISIDSLGKDKDDKK